jgi:small subunit ribosomal protein S9
VFDRGHGVGSVVGTGSGVVTGALGSIPFRFPSQRVMNILGVGRSTLRTTAAVRNVQASRALATAATPYVPPASLDHVDPRPRRSRVKAKPESPTFFTGRAGYYDSIDSLENAIHHSQRALKNLHLLPLPAFAKGALPPLQTVWKTKEDMSSLLSAKLTTSRYRRVTSLLGELNDHRRIAGVGGYSELTSGLSTILEVFERDNKAAVLARGVRKPVKFDEHGRSYTVGKRKESAARVWIIPVKQQTPPAPAETQAASPDFGTVDPISITPEKVASPVTTTEILINGMSLSKYFPLPADRESIVRPFKLTGLFGAYNVFAIVRGGGTTGQSGAVAHGIAKGLAAHVPDVELILRRCEHPPLRSRFLIPYGFLS